MRILALETSTDACSVALDDGRDTIERFDTEPRRHAALLLPMIESVLAEAGLRRQDVDAIAFGRGPGAFTGVRIAVAAAQGLALGLDVPVIPISSLAAVAEEASADDACIAVAGDARMGEVYWGVFARENGTLRAIGEERVCAPEAVSTPARVVNIGAGAGWSVYRDVLMSRLRPSRVMDTLLPRAAAVARLARTQPTLSAELALPVYLRDQVVQASRST